MQGKTEEAKSDLSRLAKIRAEREAAQAKRKAENDGELYLILHLTSSYFQAAKAAEIEAKKQAQLTGKRG